jgi:hypothetical protein
LTIKVSNKPGMSLDEIRVFLKASEAVHFEGEEKERAAMRSSPPAPEQSPVTTAARSSDFPQLERQRMHLRARLPSTV